MEALRLMLGTILIVDEKEDVWKPVRPTLTKAGYEAVDAILYHIHMPKVHNGGRRSRFSDSSFPQFW